MVERFLLPVLVLSLLISTFMTPTSAQESSGSSAQQEMVVESLPAVDSPGFAGMPLPSEDRVMIEPEYPIMPVDDDGSAFFGQDHTYSVIFRGNGEAVVNLRVALTNTSSKYSYEQSIALPDGVDARNVYAYQIVREPNCIRYSNLEYEEELMEKPLVGDRLPSQELQLAPEPNRPYCLDYDKPNYYDLYWYGETTYERLNVDQAGNTFKIPMSLAPDQQGAYLLTFRTDEYTKSDFLSTKYNFQTLKVNDEIRSLRIGIDVDADQVIKGGKADVNYRSSVDTLESAVADGAGYGSGSNAALDSYTQRMGQGKVVKTSSNLAPLETYTTEGKYADSNFKLYAREVSLAVLVILFVLVTLIVVLRFIYKRVAKDNLPKPGKGGLKKDDVRMFMLASGVSFSSSFTTMLYLSGVMFFANLIDSFVPYTFSSVVLILVFIISIAVVISIVLLPPVIVAMKKSVGWGVATFVMTILWLVLMFVIFVLILGLLFTTRSNYPIYY